MKHDIKPNLCPACGYFGDTASNADKGDTNRPEPGNFSVCLNCGLVCVFDDAMERRRITLEEVRKLPHELKTHLATMKYSCARAHGIDLNDGAIAS